MKKNNNNILILCNLYIKYNLKNILINLTKKNGEIIKQWSTKSYKDSNLKKNIFYNTFLIFLKINNYLKLKNIKKLNIFLKGNFIKKINILRNLNKKNIKICYIFYKSSLSFNGCKKKKKKH